MPFHVYIIQSDVDGSLYVGHTVNIDDRLSRHNQGRSKYTKPKRPWKLVFCEPFDTRALAMQRERELKSLHSKELLLKLIVSSR
jgi:putative endonuclease